MSRTHTLASANRAGLSWPLIVAASAFLAGLTQANRLLQDGDPYLHIAAGRWIIEHLTIPAADPFSHTFLGAPWIAFEWLAQVIFATVYATVGWIGLVIAALAAFAIALAILTRYLLRHLEPLYTLLFVAMAATLAASHLLARPHVLAWPILVLWCTTLVRAREEARAPSLWLALLMVPWANLHGSFLLGLVLIVAFATEAALSAPAGSARRRALLDWGILFAASLAASLATPYGLNGLIFVVDSHRMTTSLDFIIEWRSPDFHSLQPLEIWLMLIAGAILTRGLRLPPVRLALLLGLLHLGLKHQRHISILGLLAPIVVAEAFALQWFAKQKQADQAVALDRFFAALVAPARPAALIAVTAILLVAAAIRADSLKPEPGVAPAAAVQAALAASPPGPVLNAYAFGGYLAFIGIPTFIDGRAEALYDGRFLADMDHAFAVDPDSLSALLDRYAIGWTLLQSDTAAVAFMDRDPRWRRIYADATAVVHIRKVPQ